MDPTAKSEFSGLQQEGSAASAHRLSLDDVDPVMVEMRDLGVEVDTSPSVLEPATYAQLIREWLARRKKGGEDEDGEQPRPHGHKKVLLGDVSATLRPGTLTAIIGGSGSGKTTLLNTLAQRVASRRLVQTGRTTFNGRPDVHSVRAAYVMQQDILLPSLTVRETLRYAADLRLAGREGGADEARVVEGGADEERARVVEEVIRELGLKECADTRIGDGRRHRGCSGGEKRRVSIGVQMLANPSVLFLDEPTTGLDATSAFQLVRTAQSLAAQGRTVVATLHQPRSEIWALFDNVIVLARGGPVYTGAAAGCLAWLAAQGHELPAFVNPAEFVVDVAAVDNRSAEAEAASAARVQQLKASWRAESALRYPALPETPGPEPAQEAQLPRQHRRAASWARQTRVLTSRTLKTTYRDPMGMAAAYVQAILMGLCTGYIFFRLGRDQAGIRSRQGFLYTSTALEGYLFLVFEIYRLTVDIQTFDREHSEGCADPLPFLLSRRLARLCTEDVAVPFLFSVITYFMSGLDRSASKFFTYFALLLLNQYIAVTCAMACVVASRHFPGASLIANLAYTLQSMACGYFIQSNTISVWLRWLKWLTYTFYLFSALCENEFRGSFYDCPYDAADAACTPYTGDYILASLGFPPDWHWRPIVVLVAFVVFFYTLAALGLSFLPVEMTLARSRVADTDLSAGKEKMAVPEAAEARTVEVCLHDFALAVDKRTLWGRGGGGGGRAVLLPRETKTILQPVSAVFAPGVLNVIMGPSGSGKTSLLNAMAQRLPSSVGARYRVAGRLTLNGAEPTAAVLRSVCSYVCQDDDALLPSLTVRETLRFAAGLRLPAFLSRAEKDARAEAVLRKMGLKDCADTLVGSALVKGISGGEKRRVSIAVQMLTEPRLLLLDEPTSGLDAFTAASIMEALRGLAGEGRTVVLTIHQARSDLYRHFGHLLLLARGGATVYAGSSAAMPAYFARLGFACPRDTNPADFALDLVTVDLQQDSREAASRERVRQLTEAWAAQREATEATQREATQREADSRPRTAPANTVATPAQLGALVHAPAPLATALPLLVHRALLNFGRQPPLLLARLMQVAGFAIVVACFFAPIGHGQASVQNRVGLVQQVSSLYFVGMLQNVAVYPAERDVFYREHDDGAYAPEAFLAAYTLLELPAELLSSLLYGLLADLAVVGLPRTAPVYFVSAFCCLAIVSCGESLGIVFNTLLADNTGFAVTLISILLSVANIMAGIMSIDMPRLFVAFNYLTPTRYAVRALAPVSLRPVVFSCTEAQRLAPDGRCPVADGRQVLALYKLDGSVAVNLAALAAVMVVYRLLAWAVLRAVRWRR